MELRLRTWPTRLVVRPWLLAFVPINAATSGFGVALPLLILTTLGGSWAQVAVAASLFNVAVIGASFFWGYVSDHYPSRRNLLLLNFIGFAAIYLLLADIRDITTLYVLYVAVGVIAPAGASASNLLILEQFAERERPSAFASFQEMSMIGAVLGLLAGYGWLEWHLSLPALMYVLAVLAVASGVAVQVGIRESRRKEPAEAMTRHAESLAARLSHPGGLRMAFPFFPKRPRLGPRPVARFRRWVREEVHHELPLIFAAMFLFNLSSNLFNISYTPYLFAVGIGGASIFLVNFANNMAQGLAFPASGGLTGRLGADRLVHQSTYVRSLGYLAVAGFTFVPLLSGTAFLLNAAAFGILGAAIAFYSTSSSMILFRALAGRDAGSLLGLNSALGGVAAVAGAAMAGVLALSGSFRLTFLVSAGSLLASLPLWSAVEVASVRRRHEDPAPAPPRGPSHPTPGPAKAD